jgi:ABC-type methionine transport system ATPase subunit
LERAVAELERLGLTSLKDQLAKPLSAVSPAEARTISLVRFAAEAPRMIGLDEPTAGMTQSQLFEYCSVVRALAARIPMLVGTKDALAAREFGGFVSLLAGGRLVEQRPAKDFFRAPRTASAKQYVREGVCPNPPIHAGPDQADARFRLQYPEFFPDASAPTGNEFLRACQSYAPPATTEGPTSVRRWGIDGRRTPTIPYLPSREVADVETMDGGGTARDAD